MGELTLMSRPPLDGYTGESDGLRLAERSGMAVVSVAVPAHARDEFAVNLRDAWGIDAPPVGRSVVSESGPRLIGLQAAQWFVLMEDAGDRAEKLVAEALGTDVHLTDQSDGWAALEVTGSSLLCCALESECNFLCFSGHLNHLSPNIRSKSLPTLA